MPDRVRGAVGVGQHGRRRDVGDLPADAAGQIEGERDPGRLERDGDRQRAGLGDGDQGRAQNDAGEQRLRLGHEVREQGGAVARRAVVEHDVGAQGDRPRRVLGVGHDGFGQVGRPVPVGQNDGQRVEHGAGVHDADLVEAGLGRVEARLLGVHAEDERPALLGRSFEMPLRPGPLVTAPAMPSSPMPSAPPPRRLRRRLRRPPAPNDDQISRPSVLHFNEPAGPPEGSRATLVPRIPCVGAVRWPSCRHWDLPGFSAWLGGRAAAIRPAYVSDVTLFAGWMSRSDIDGPAGVDRMLLRRYLASLGTRKLARASHRPQGRGAALLLLLAGPAGSPRLRSGPLPPGSFGWRAPAPAPLERGGHVPPGRAVRTPVDRRDLAVLELLYAAGLRVSELCGLDRSDIDLRGRTVTVLGKGANSDGCLFTMLRSPHCGPGSTVAATPWTVRPRRPS